MSSELEKATDFQTRMFDRIREQMGELLTETELKQIVEKALDKAFLDQVQTIRLSSYGRAEEVPVQAPFIGMVRELVRPQVEKAAKEWCESHPDEIKKIIDDQIGEGIVKAVVRWVEGRVQHPLDQLRHSIEQALTLKH